MNALRYQPSLEENPSNDSSQFVSSTRRNSNKSGIAGESLMTSDAIYGMAHGQIPDLWNVCYQLYQTFFRKDAPYSALQFVPVLKKLINVKHVETELFLKNPDTNHVLIHNELLKVVLIHWPSGKISNIHGHPEGGCVFKVLHGSIEEMRYTTGGSPQLLSVSTYHRGGMGYIDDEIAYHAVGNPFNGPAISLHAYTPGFKLSNLK